jgi:hypothetical protein
MDLSFSNQFGKAAASPPVNMKFTQIIATAVARQMGGKSCTYNFGSTQNYTGTSDPLQDRIAYFSSRQNAATLCRNGAFLPGGSAERTAINKDEVGIYPAASAIGKPCSDINGLPDLPEYLRGMENRGRND